MTGMEDLEARIAAALAEALGDAGAGTALARRVVALTLDWRAPTAPPAAAELIVAYAFGNRPAAPGGGDPAEPGPVNEALAEAVLALRRARPVRVYAQWEIARRLAGRMEADALVSIEPERGADGVVTYLSTEGVARAIVRFEADRGAARRAAVVAHRDHARRCVEVSRRCGLDAFVAEAPELPSLYDPGSGQAWTRDRETYLVHDIAARWIELRAELIARAEPSR